MNRGQPIKNVKTNDPTTYKILQTLSKQIPDDNTTSQQHYGGNLWAATVTSIPKQKLNRTGQGGYNKLVRFTPHGASAFDNV